MGKRVGTCIQRTMLLPVAQYWDQRNSHNRLHYYLVLYFNLLSNGLVVR